MERLPPRVGYLECFPGYGEMGVTIPEGFEDHSFWHDTMPRFIHAEKRLDLWIDFPRREDREDETGTRFHVFTVDPEDPSTPGVYLLSSDDWAEVVDLLTAPVERVLALTFAKMLEEEVGDENFQQVRARNAEHKRNGETDVCASHDFCDANMTMLDALRAVTGREEEIDNESAALWNAAWSIAFTDYLS